MSTPLCFDDPAPDWAAACVYCHRDEWGLYDQERHQRDHQPMTCTVCGETEPNRAVFELSHGITLGGSWEIDALLCVSLWCRINHVTYAIQHRETPAARDATVFTLGWMFRPDGTPIHPANWPDGTHATSCTTIAVAS